MGKARGSSSRARRGSSNTYAPHKRSGAPPPSSTVKYYAVQRGKDGFRGVLTTWADCRKYVIGHKGSVYKSFRSAAEAEAFTLDSPTATAPQGMEQQETPARRERVGTVRCPEPVNRATGGSSAHLVLYTDGACSKNGKKGSRAGYGVYFGENDPRNISAPLPGKATNQRAEMMAVLVAMRSVLDDHMLAPGGTLTIRTDSMYTKNGLDSWIRGWKCKNWKTSGGDPVKNQDLWMSLDEQRSNICRAGIKLDIEWVKGHSGTPGNEAADRLAVAGMDA